MSTRSLLLTGTLLGALAMAGSASAAVNLIVNGGFANGAIAPNGTFQTVDSDPDFIPGWEVLAGNVDWIKGFWESSDGDGYSIDLSGNNSAGTIGQSILTTIGQLYTLRFDLS